VLLLLSLLRGKDVAVMEMAVPSVFASLAVLCSVCQSNLGVPSQHYPPGDMWCFLSTHAQSPPNSGA
jgi:hypothetical protein